MTFPQLSTVTRDGSNLVEQIGEARVHAEVEHDEPLQPAKVIAARVVAERYGQAPAR